ncbi:hypothetical protein DDV21_002930 [Streptococcus chenjunshii]|uniref:Uncharacterized protein n=1 Tax=Streptococcus chenjunshii TaxID=2173853 RepID=A0A372KLU9_9STRE|nr:hypothetical protein DDV21_002930 [Streptococcus chenjunshii]RFU51198.1 hypothetical protein DDV22_04880 [Streptococcus chenjunshii]RFU53262.1 hypothetical protein DDV23_05225 [Streptococcus chenjunshii]
MTHIAADFIFFTRILGRVQFTKIQRPLKTQKENRRLTTESLKTQGKSIFFPQRLGRVQFHQDTKAVKSSQQK